MYNITQIALDITSKMEAEFRVRFNPRVMPFHLRTFTMNDTRKVSRVQAREIIQFVREHFKVLESENPNIEEYDKGENEKTVNAPENVGLAGMRPVIRGFVHPMPDEATNNPRYSIRVSW